MTRNQVISDRVWMGLQSANREIIEDISGDRIRITVKVDAYVFQSEATAEKWNGSQWHTIHRIPGEAMASCGNTSYTRKNTSPEAFAADIEELRRVVKAVLS